MPYKFGAKWRPPTELIELLRGLGDRLGDFTPVMRSLSDLFTDDVKGHISSRGEGSWSQLSPDTIRIHGAHPPLMLTHALYNSIRPVWGEDFAAAYTRNPVAHLQDLGTQRHAIDGKRVNLSKRSKSERRDARITKRLSSSRHTPARPFMYFSAAMKDLAIDAILDYAAGVERGQLRSGQ